MTFISEHFWDLGCPQRNAYYYVLRELVSLSAFDLGSFDGVAHWGKDFDRLLGLLKP